MALLETFVVFVVVDIIVVDIVVNVGVVVLFVDSDHILFSEGQ